MENESLDNYFSSLKDLNGLSNQFNPWWHRAINSVVKRFNFSIFKKKSYISPDDTHCDLSKKSLNIPETILLCLPLCLSLMSCGSHDDFTNNRKPEQTSINYQQFNVNEFSAFYELFKFEATKRHVALDVKALVIRFEHIPDEQVMGRCIIFGEEYETLIIVDPAKWNTVSYIEQQLLMFHELGHCILRRVHESSQISIMFPNVMNDTTFVKKQSAILDELFDVKKFNTFN